MQAARRSSAANEEMMIVVLLMFCCVAMVIAAIGFYLTGQDQEGTPCKGDDENAEYERDDEGDCVYKGCKIGYAVNEDGICVFDQSGKDCEGSDPNAIYETNVSNVCSFVMCNYGYNIGEDGNCVIPEEGGDPAADSATDSATDSAPDSAPDPAPDPVNCVGDWEFPNGSCNRSCGDYIDSFQYVITTEAAHGGAACPHAAGDIEQRSCPYTACPTVDTTETIDGVTYDVKYYDNIDGHAGYYVQRNGPYWHSPTMTIWNGETKTSADFGTGTEPDPIQGSDGHGYLRGTEQSTHGNYTRYSVKRSQQPILQPGTCVLNKATEYTKKLDGKSDYECAGMCGGMQSESTCEDSHKACDYIVDGVPSYQVSSRSGTALSGACKWLGEGETQEIEPRWKTEDETIPGAGTYPYIYKGDVIKTVEGWMGRGDPDALTKTDKKCKRECFEDKSCVGYNLNKEIWNLDVKKTCDLFSSVTDKQWWDTSRRGYKIERKYG